jgi:hypothetical protein
MSLSGRSIDISQEPLWATLPALRGSSLLERETIKIDSLTPLVQKIVRSGSFGGRTFGLNDGAYA